jgi:hypothetical protein
LSFDRRHATADEFFGAGGTFRVVSVPLVDDVVKHASCLVSLTASLGHDSQRGTCASETINSGACFLSCHAVEHGSDAIKKCTLSVLRESSRGSSQRGSVVIRPPPRNLCPSSPSPRPELLTTPVRLLLSSTEARDVLDRHIPGLSHTEQLNLPAGATLLQLARMGITPASSLKALAEYMAAQS